MIKNHLALNLRLNSQKTRSTILNLVRLYPGISRARLAQILGMSRTAITDFVDHLIEQRLLAEDGASQTGRGRKPIRLKIAAGEHFFQVIYISGDKIRVASLDFCGDILSSDIQALHSQASLEDRLNQLDRSLQRTRKEAGLKSDQIEAIGCGIASHVDVAKGMVLYSENIPGWDGLPLRQILADRYGIPCYLETGRRLLTLAEKYYGKARTAENFIYLNVDVGISLGVFAGTSLYHGACGGAGEIGHVQVLPEGPLCNCGKLGCLERMASASNIVQEVRQALREGTRSLLRDDYVRAPESITPESIANAAAQGDVLALRIIGNAGEFIGKVLASSIQTLNPEMLVMGGPIFRQGSALFDQIQRSLRERLLPYIMDALKIEVSSLDYDTSFFLGGLVLISETHWQPQIASPAMKSLVETTSIALPEKNEEIIA